MLCRYLLRPPIALERLELHPSGKLRYSLKKTWSDDCESGLCCPSGFQDTRCFDGDACLALIGDSCFGSHNCASGDCEPFEEYCGARCSSDADCGFNSAGIQNFCVGSNPPFCARSCVGSSCSGLPSTTCQDWSGRMVCN